MRRVRAERPLLVIASLALAACARTPPELELSGPTMGTIYTVKIARPPSTTDPEQLRRAIEAELARIDRAMSSYRSDSTLSAFNLQPSTDWTDVGADLTRVVTAALEVSRASDGAFDVTVAPLVDAWGFGPLGEAPQIPDAQHLADLRAHVGYQKLESRVAPHAIRKDDPLLTVDLNGIAPGFAVDELASLLKASGVTDFMIDVGGEIRIEGRNQKGQPWRIAVERPIEDARVPYAIVASETLSVSTSGDYRHYYVRDGHRYSHTIDPRTGRPIEHDLAAVVVIASTTMQADAWATALNVLGDKEGYELARTRGLTALFIAREGEKLTWRVTGGFERYFAVPPADT